MVNDSLAFGGLSEVCDEEFDGEAGALHNGEEVVHGGGKPGGDEYGGAFCEAGAGDRGSDTGGTAGHENHFAVEA